jgi:competence protein ComEC
VDSSLGGITGRFVRRAGVARCVTVAAAIGVALAGIIPGRYSLAMGGLTLALAGVSLGPLVTRARPLSTCGLGVTLVSVVLIGLLGGMLAGTLRVSTLLDGTLSSHIGARVDAEVVITGPVRARAGWQSATAVVQRLTDTTGNVRTAGLRAGADPRGQSTGVGERVLLEVPPADGGGVPALAQGMIISAGGTLRAPDGPSASGFDQAAQLLHQGIHVVLRADGERVSVRGQRGGVAGWFDHLRASAKEHLSLGPDARVDEVLQGVVMGDTAGIDEGWMEAFRRSGTAHMLSVSGLHVASLAAIVIGLAGLLRVSRRMGFLLAAAAALLMIPFVGSSPPIVRSAAMIVVVLAGRWVGRRRDPWQGLALAALVVLALNPFAVFDVGFQLSFSAFAGMLALVRPLERLLRKLPTAVRAGLAVSVAATLGTAPVSLLVFGRTSLVSPLANLLVVPALAPVTALGMASVLLGFIWSGFSVALDTLASLPMSWTILISSLCARAPVLAASDLGRAGFASALALASVPLALVLAGRDVSLPFGLRVPLLRPVAARLGVRRPRASRLAAVVSVGVVVAALALGAGLYPAAAAGLRQLETRLGATRWPEQPEMRVLDVGQGTAVLLRTPGRHTALFDAGPAGCDLGDQLRSLGVERLDLVVISHPHADHFAGLSECLDSLKIGTFVDGTVSTRPADVGAGGASAPSSAGSSSPDGADQGEAAQYLGLREGSIERGARYLQALPGSSLTLDGVTVTFFTPARPLTMFTGPHPWGEGRDPPSGDQLNGVSLVALLDAGETEVLIPGDAEAGILERYRLPPVDAIVIPHHGSRGAVSERLLSALQARVAIISVGEGNGFGHPDPGTVRLLATAGDTIVRTDESGWVSLLMDEDEMVVMTERTPAR